MGGNASRSSSLATVVASIAEQHQISKGTDYAFLWKPKLRIPDIYEHPANQRAFAKLLDSCDPLKRLPNRFMPSGYGGRPVRRRLVQGAASEAVRTRKKCSTGRTATIPSSPATPFATSIISRTSASTLSL